MIRLMLACLCLFTVSVSFSQTPVPMVSQPSLTYTEDFSDIANWADNFTSGIGSACWSSVPVNLTGTIGDGKRTSHTTAAFVSASSDGVQRGSLSGNPAGTIVLLSTNPTSNSRACAIDIHLDFTGVDPGTISFDWTRVNNSTGDRGASLKVFTSVDGITFTELIPAAVSNIINNGGTASGTISPINLPASFSNNANARIRFYYYNGTFTGTTGSRPKISIDNLSITAVPNIPCATPAAQPTALNFGTITSTSIDGSFTAASPAANGYLVVISNNSSLTSLPVDGTTYNLGDNIGDGYVVANGNALSFSATGLSPLTTYYFFIFSVNNVCIGSVKYLTVNPLTGNTMTAAGLPPCAAPPLQPFNLNFGTTTVNSIQGSFSPASADGYLVLRSTAASLSANPVNTVSYITGDIIGNATVVQQNNLTAFTATGLSPITLYYFYIFSYSNIGCSNGPVYNITGPLTGSWTTANLSPCTTPTTQPSHISFTVADTAIAGAFNAGTGNDAYLIVRSLNPALSSSPVNNTDYIAGDNIGGGIVIANSANKSFLTTGLTPNTTYYFYVFAASELCSGGTKYLTANPLEGNATTTNNPGNHFYFGNLHAHSDYSDGNQDNPGFTPADDYQYAMASQCMDYLGISEHNHYTSNNNPGNKLSTYGLGFTQATNFTTANPGFLALYGMEWGVISNGGHVLIYGDGMNNLWGWESGNGGWGATNNYNEFIAKSDYTSGVGLFQTVNNNSATNTFASLAHPGSSDYGNLSNIAYNSSFDDAIAATAVESGPSTSSNTTYSNPASPMNYLDYFKRLLSKGYHLAPTIDHDNHNTTFGRTTYSRSAVIAPALTKTEIIKGFHNMHVYATQDCDSKVDFTVNTKIMGSMVAAAGAPVIHVNITDATTSLSGAVIKIMFGIPGSNNNAVEINSAIGSSLTYIDNNLVNGTTGYYYIDITNGSSRIITAPVWYSRSDLFILPVSFSSFTAQKLNKTVLLNWTTEQEFNSSHFIIERSADGRTWNTIATIPAAGNSSNQLRYTAYDNYPLKGNNYYRIKEFDRDGKFLASVVRNINFDAEYFITVSPNPATDMVTITMKKISNSNSLIQLFDAAGNIALTEKTNLTALKINVSALSKGLYFIKISNAGQVYTQKLLLH